MELSEKTIGLWFVCGEDKDWMGAAVSQDDGTVNISYRFRYYVDDKAHDSADKKNWYECNVVDSPAKVIEVMRKLVDKLVEEEGEPHEILMVNHGSMESFIAELESLPWIHMKQVPAND